MEMLWCFIKILYDVFIYTFLALHSLMHFAVFVATIEFDQEIIDYSLGPG